MRLSKHVWPASTCSNTQCCNVARRSKQFNMRHHDFFALFFTSCGSQWIEPYCCKVKGPGLIPALLHLLQQGPPRACPPLALHVKVDWGSLEQGTWIINRGQDALCQISPPPTTEAHPNKLSHAAARYKPTGEKPTSTSPPAGHLVLYVNFKSVYCTGDWINCM